MKKRVLSFVLVLIMVMTMMPANIAKADETSYPFTITCQNGKYTLTYITESSVNVWGTDVPTYQVAIPEGTTIVDVTFPSGTSFVQYTMSYDTGSGETGYGTPGISPKTNDNGTVTMTIPVEDYTDTGMGILLENESYKPCYGFDFTIIEGLDFPVNINLDDSIYSSWDNFVKQITVDGATVRDYQIGTYYYESSTSWYRNLDIYLTEETADDATITLNYIVDNDKSFKQFKVDGNSVSDKKSEVTLVDGAAQFVLTTQGPYSQHPVRNYTITINKMTEAQVEEYNKKVAEDVKALIDAIGEVVYTDDCKEKIKNARKAYDLLSKAQKKLVENYDNLEIAEEAMELLKVTRIDMVYNLRGGMTLGAPTITTEGAVIRQSGAKVYWYQYDIEQGKTVASGLYGKEAAYDTYYLMEIYIDPADNYEFADGKYFYITYDGKELDYADTRTADTFEENGSGYVARALIYVPKAEMYGVVDLEDTTFENGTKVSQMGLPETMTVEAEGGNIELPVTWDIDELPYDFTSTKEQSFTIYGTIALEDIPSYVEYNEEISLTRAFNVTVKAADAQDKADEVAAKIAALKDITLDSKADLETARAAYEALTDEQKALVEGYDKLVLAESLYNALEKQAAADAAAKAEADKATEAANEELKQLKAVFALTTKQTKVAVEAQTKKNIAATWDAVEGADSYVVEVLRNGKTVETVTTEELAYTYNGGKAGYAYTVKVTPAITYNNDVYRGIEAKDTVIVKPATPSITVKKSASKFKVSAKKRVCTGYQIQVSKKKNFKTGVKKYTVKKATLAKSIKLSTLKKGTNYVRVRAYTTYDGTTVYGKWSKVKTVKK